MNEEYNEKEYCKLTPEELEAYYAEGDESLTQNAFEDFKDNNPRGTYTCKAGPVMTKDRGSSERTLGGGEPDNKMRMALLDYVEDPFQKKKEISARWGINHAQFLRAIKTYDTWICKESERVWRSKKPQMMRKMEELAIDDKNFKALEFVLRSLGVNPTQNVDTTQEIILNIGKKEDN